MPEKLLSLMVSVLMPDAIAPPYAQKTSSGSTETGMLSAVHPLPVNVVLTASALSVRLQLQMLPMKGATNAQQVWTSPSSSHWRISLRASLTSMCSRPLVSGPSWKLPSR